MLPAIHLSWRDDGVLQKEQAHGRNERSQRDLHVSTFLLSDCLSCNVRVLGYTSTKRRCSESNLPFASTDYDVPVAVKVEEKKMMQSRGESLCQTANDTTNS